MEAFEQIPNNVNLSSDKRLQRALLQWLPNYLSWWREMGPEGFQEDDVYLRTAISVETDGWAHFDYVKMPAYRWGIFLTPREESRVIHFGDHLGQPAWQEVPGEYRNMLRRIIVTQGDTEPASVEQQRLLGQTAPSMYDLRNLFQVNVEEGRHLWAMVYLLQSYFGKDGREEAEALLERRSGDRDKPRILGAFNQPIENWLDFFMFTMFTDRDGKFQLYALSESGFDPLARTCKFMLTEEAHHMFVGETGVGRVVERSCELMKQLGTQDPEAVRAQGGIPLTMLQRHINLWFSLSEDLFGGEISSNAADFFAAGLKGRYKEANYTDHVALSESYDMAVPKAGPGPDDQSIGQPLDQTPGQQPGQPLSDDGGPAQSHGIEQQQIPLRTAMNEVLRDQYVSDCQRAVDKWNRTIERVLGPTAEGHKLRLPHRRFHRHIGLYSMEGGHFYDIDGQQISKTQFAATRDRHLPNDGDRAYVRDLMHPVLRPGQIAHWIAPPARGVNGQPFEFEYVRR